MTVVAIVADKAHAEAIYHFDPENPSLTTCQIFFL
jgi:hypothetical protein